MAGDSKVPAEGLTNELLALDNIGEKAPSESVIDQQQTALAEQQQQGYHFTWRASLVGSFLGCFVGKLPYSHSFRLFTHPIFSLLLSFI